MKIRQVSIGVAGVAVMAIAVPALASNHGGPRRRARTATERQAGHLSAHHSPEPKLDGVGARFRFTTPGLDAADAARLAQSGAIALPIDFSAPGTVRALGYAPVGTATETAIGTAPDGHSEEFSVPRDYAPVTVPASATATAAGVADLPLRLTDAAKRTLASGSDLRLSLMLRPSDGSAALAMMVRLPGS